MVLPLYTAVMLLPRQKNETSPPPPVGALAPECWYTKRTEKVLQLHKLPPAAVENHIANLFGSTALPGKHPHTTNAAHHRRAPLLKGALTSAQLPQPSDT